MRGPRTISFFDGENSMSGDVAFQRVTGSTLGHPFLHPAPVGAIGLERKRLSAEFSRLQNQKRRQQIHGSPSM